MSHTKIKSALISVFNKEGLEPVLKKLNQLGVKIYSTGGTQKFIEDQGVPVTAVEDLTSYPSILGGRVKTLHPKVFGGILARRENGEDISELNSYQIPEVDLVIVDLYPFEKTVASGAEHQDIIEKIDIGGISLIRAAAKNYKDVLIVPSVDHYDSLIELLSIHGAESTEEERRSFARDAFDISSHYDTHIFEYFNKGKKAVFKNSIRKSETLRYGENPHQNGVFYGDLEAMFDKLHGKELSYNNLLDVDAAVNLMAEFKDEKPTFAILKHNNACGLATRDSISEAYSAALAGDPVSAFGGILISNTTIDLPTAEKINDLFCEVVIAPKFDDEAEELLKSKKNRILLVQKEVALPKKQFRTILNGVLEQDKDMITDQVKDFEKVTKAEASERELTDLEFANKLVKHTKSNTIVFAKNLQLCASGTGQTSRVDALKQAVVKAKAFDFDLNGAVMASDAFFPFPDCVELADEAGVKAVIQPGGSIKDKLSIEYCDAHGMSMYFTGNRHFRH
ncbi:bifunctional phosphoribosylaminoimidazolecarboxamide formyltransferase/IMP cyclohydrolase [Halocola ammonii]